MACSVTNSINKALAACGACTAEGAQRDIVLVDRMSNDRAFPSNQITSKLSSKIVDAQGRIAHVRGIILCGNVRITSAAVSDAISSFNLRKLLRQLKLTDIAGHQYFQGLDARSLLDDVFFRHWARQAGVFGRMNAGVQGILSPTITMDAGVPINANVTGNYDITTYYPTVSLGPEFNPLEGLIPLAALQLAQDGPLQMTFGVTGDLAGTPVGQTVVEYRRKDNTVGFDIFLDIVYLPAVIVDEAWQVAHYTENELTADFPNGDRRTEGFYLRYLPEDAAALAGQALAAQNAGINLTVGGNAIIAGRTNLDVQLRGEFFAGAGRGASARDNAAQDLPMIDIAGGGVPLALVLLPHAPRESSAAGTITFGAEVRTPTFWRILHRTVKCPGAQGAAERAALFYRAAKCGPCGRIFGTSMYGESTLKLNNMRPMVLQPSNFSK